jgi:uncharacterized protein YndB with AHSA1/START domain
MPEPRFRLQNHWGLDVPPEPVWGLPTEPERSPGWWPQVLRVERLDRGTGRASAPATAPAGAGDCPIG